MLVQKGLQVHSPTGGCNGLCTPSYDVFFSEAHDAGARVHTNSWGSGPSASNSCSGGSCLAYYSTTAYQIDTEANSLTDLTILYAMGNDAMDCTYNSYGQTNCYGGNSLTADFHLAAAYQQANRCKDAIPLFMNVAQKSREQHERMMHIDNIKDGRAQKLESSIPAHEAFLRAGGCKFLMGEVDGAIELYREALVSSDKFAPALVNWGIALEHKKEYDKAEEKYILAVEKNPNMAEAYARWGTLNFGQARTLVQAFVHKQREEKNKKKVWKDPEESKERKELGLLIDAAFSRLEKAAALDPTHSINQRLAFMRQQAKALIKEVEGKNSQMDEPWDLKEERENSQQK